MVIGSIHRSTILSRERKVEEMKNISSGNRKEQAKITRGSHVMMVIRTHLSGGSWEIWGHKSMKNRMSASEPLTKYLLSP